MLEKDVFIIAKIFNQQGSLAYRCKTINEARCLPGVLESLRAEGVQIVILDNLEIYAEYDPYSFITDMKGFIDSVSALNKTA